MPSIHKLDETLSNQIAAGEVVERPASVVKELLENAIDGGGKNIEIVLEDGGLELIRIVDDGIGMDEEDAILSLQRHATSKISNVHDLFRIQSLGFRGEALPSIASVSHFEMITSTGSGPGTRLVAEGGKIMEQSKAQSRKGTDILVKNLFYNTPARLKYMKSISTELGHILDVVQKLSLSFPEISFRVVHNNRRVYQTLGTGNVLHVLSMLYGREAGKNMQEIAAVGEGFFVSGYIAAPDLNRSNRNAMYLSVNHRMIKNYNLNRSIVLGYEGQLMKGRFPVVYCNIEVEPILVDVNVHPSKQEVRLSKEREIGLAMEQAIAAKLRESQYIAHGLHPKQAQKQQDKVKKEKFEQQNFLFAKHQETFISDDPKQLIQYPIPNKTWQTDQTASEKKTVDIVQEIPQKYVVSNHQKDKMQNIKRKEKTTDHLPKTQVGTKTEAKTNTNHPKLDTLYPVGQVHGTYIVAQNQDGMYLIDQHAAQERLFYDKNRQKYLHKRFIYQSLLVPVTIEVTKAEAFILEDKHEILQQIGINLEPFGERTYMVRECPDFFPAGKEEVCVRELIDYVLAAKEIREEQIREDALALMSCKASIKANHHLSEQEMFQLLEDLRHSKSPYTCPHGRPILLCFTQSDLEKMFKRQV